MYGESGGRPALASTLGGRFGAKALVDREQLCKTLPRIPRWYSSGCHRGVVGSMDWLSNTLNAQAFRVWVGASGSASQRRNSVGPVSVMAEICWLSSVADGVNPGRLGGTARALARASMRQ